MAFAFEIVRIARAEEPGLFDAEMEGAIVAMLEEAIASELAFADDLLSGGVLGLAREDVRRYLEHVADQRLATLGIAPRYGAPNRSRTWPYRTCRRSRTSSSAASPRTRSAS